MPKKKWIPFLNKFGDEEIISSDNEWKQFWSIFWKCETFFCVNEFYSILLYVTSRHAISPNNLEQKYNITYIKGEYIIINEYGI